MPCADGQWRVLNVTIDVACDCCIGLGHWSSSSCKENLCSYLLVIYTCYLPEAYDRSAGVCGCVGLLLEYGVRWRYYVQRRDQGALSRPSIGPRSMATTALSNQACKRCYNRKKRCSRTLPRCQACEQSNVQCSFEQQHEETGVFYISYVSPPASHSF